jgi:NDP-sugar pyrophosphorylase family protein
VIINTHHFADLVVDYLCSHSNFGMQITISREEILLDTGGGLKQAAHFFLSGGDPDEPFLVHNVDVLSTIDFGRMLRFHLDNDALATLAVKNRPTSRYLLFDKDRQLCGRRAGLDGPPELVRSVEEFQAFAFCGVHILSPRIFEPMKETGVFSIIPVYLRLAAQNERVVGFPADGYYWRDLGRPEHISEAIRDISDGTYPF